MLRFPRFAGRVENEKCCESEISQTFGKYCTDYDCGTRVQQKLCEATDGIRTNLDNLDNFSGGKWVAMKNSEHIEYIWYYATDFLHFFSARVWKYNRLLNKKYWDDFDIIDQSHSKDSKGYVSQFCLHLCYPWTNFNQLSTTMMSSRPATKMYYHLTLKT